MRSRLALFVVVAVVFAPAWQEGGSPEPPRGSELAARVLAPTVDEGAVRDDVADVKHQVGARQAKRRPSFISTAVDGYGFVATVLVVVWMLASSRRSFLPRPALHAALSRAPPRLQPA
jgi:hypothetical protein